MYFDKPELTYEQAMRLRSITIKCGEVTACFPTLRAVFKAYPQCFKQRWRDVSLTLLNGETYNLYSDFYKTFSIYAHKKERHVYRQGPVPGVYTRKASRRGCYRHVRSLNERTQWYELKSEDHWLNENHGLKIKARLKRSEHSLPNLWDDIVSAKPQRSWKHQRRTQWK